MKVRLSWENGKSHLGVLDSRGSVNTMKNNVESTLELHRKDTVTTYGTRISFKSSELKSGHNKENYCLTSDNCSDEKTVSIKRKSWYILLVASCKFIVSDNSRQPKIFWSHKMGRQQVQFHNTPYIVTATCKLDCQFGKHYFKERVRKNTKQTILQGTRKVGCLAKVIVKQLS